MKKILIITTLVLLCVGTYSYLNRNDEIFDRIFSAEEQKIRVSLRKYQYVKSFFPDRIGEFNLAYQHVGERRAEVSEHSECVDAESVKKYLGEEASGSYCSLFYRAEYRNLKTSEIIFVHLLKFTSGGDIALSMYKKITKSDIVTGGIELRRLENHELFWFPRSDFNLILIQEGRFKNEPQGGESMSYGRAAGVNDVTRYYLKLFSPNN